MLKIHVTLPISGKVFTGFETGKQYAELIGLGKDMPCKYLITVPDGTYTVSTSFVRGLLEPFHMLSAAELQECIEFESSSPKLNDIMKLHLLQISRLPRARVSDEQLDQLLKDIGIAQFHGKIHNGAIYARDGYAAIDRMIKSIEIPKSKFRQFMRLLWAK